MPSKVTLTITEELGPTDGHIPSLRLAKGVDGR